jgi:hypothetical protein
VTDGCGNEQTCEYEFVVKDCKAPTVICHNGLSMNIMPTGMATVWATDFLQYSEDNCTPTPLLKYAIRKAGASTGFPLDPVTGLPITSLTFDCTELGDQPVELWAQDLAGNAGYCTTFVTVQDNAGNCNTDNKTVAGKLETEMGEGVEDAKSTLQITPSGGNPANYLDMTDDQGAYIFTNMLPAGADFTVMPFKDDNPLNGVSTFDIVLITKHILGLEVLNSPYKMIAADANKSNSITTYDIVEIRKLILGLNSDFPSNNAWRFVDKNFTFPDPTNPFLLQFPEIVQVANAQASFFNTDFVSVKIGDVNNTAIPNSFVQTDDRTAGTLYFDLNDKNLQAGDEFVAAFKAAESTAGYQFTLNTNGLEVWEILPGESMKVDNFAVFADAITASVNGDARAFRVKFRATKAGKLSEMLSLSHRITRAEAYTEAGDRNDVALRFNGSTVVGAGFELFQNTPNPVSGATNIAFNLPEATEATLTISNVEGRVVKMVKGQFAKGLNAIALQRDELEAGILFYQLDTPTHSAVKKMIVTE